MNAIPYLIVATILLLLYLCERQRIKLLSPPSAGWIAFVVMLLFVGLRGHLYSDFINYYPFYNALPDIGHLNIGTFKRYLFEPGFVIYSSLIKSLGVDYFGWVAISTLIDLAVYRCIFRRYTDSVILPFLFFMAYNGLTIEFNLYRNAKAMDLFLLSLPHLEKRRIGRYMILNLLGTTLHLSSVVYLPLYFLLNRRLGKVIRWGGIVFANAIVIGGVSVIADILSSLEVFQAMAFYDKLSQHASHSITGYAMSFGHIERTFAIVLFTALYDRLERQRPSNRIFYNCVWIYYLSFMLLHEVEVFVDRVPTLFVCGYWVLYSNVATLKWRWRQVILLVAVVLALAKLTIANQSIAARYDNIIWGTSPYNARRGEITPLLNK